MYAYLDGIWSITTVDNGITSCSTLSKSFGYSNIPYRVPITENSHFPIASNSKLFTAVAIYQLHEDGKLDVDADIATMSDASDFANFDLPQTQKLCPQVSRSSSHDAIKCEKMTLRHILSMSAGIYPALRCDVKPATKSQ